MKTLRNGAFLALVAVALFAGQGRLLAFDWPPPTFNNCPAGCTCDVGWQPEQWTEVTIDCPNEASVDICPYAWWSAYDYCNIDLPQYIETYYWAEFTECVDVQCWIEHYEGCTPQGLEPPTYIELFCECQLLGC